MERSVYYSELSSAGLNPDDVSKQEMKNYLGLSGQILSMRHHTLGDPDDAAIVVTFSGETSSTYANDPDYDPIFLLGDFD